MHISSADGDYSSRILRNSGTNGQLNFSQTGTGDFIHSHLSPSFTKATGPYHRFDNTGLMIYRGTGLDMDDAPYSLWIRQPITAAAAVPAAEASIFADASYNAVEPTSPFSIGYGGFSSKILYGNTNAGTIGTTLNRLAETRIMGSGDVRNEIGIEHSHLVTLGAYPASIWYLDYSMHGPIGMQPGLLNGISMFCNNYYNGSPARPGSVTYSTGINVVTRPTGGVSASFTELHTTTYPLDIGLVVAGFTGTYNEVTKTNGFNIGIQVGGEGGNYLQSNAPDISRIGTGIMIDDIVTTGIEYSQPATSATTAVGMKFNSPTRAWDIFMDLSGGVAPTTAGIKLGSRTILGTTMQLYEPSANTFDILAISSTLSLLRVVPNATTVVDTATRGDIRVLNSSGANSEYLDIAATGTNGYRLNISKVSSGSLRAFNLMMDGNNCITVNTDNSMSFNNRSTSGLLQKFNDVTKVNTDSPYSILTTDDIIRANATSGALTVTLPTAVGVTGKAYRIMRVDTIVSSNLVTVATTSSQTISNTASWYLWPGEYVTVESDGANWIALAYSNPNQSNYYFLGGSTPNARYIAGMIPDTTGALTTSTTSPAANTLWALPLMVGKPTKFDLLTFNVTTGAAINARAGIYRDSGACYPGALIFDTGSIDCTSAVEKTTTITAGLQTFAPGLYWLAWECASATIQIRILPPNSLWGILGFTGSANIPRYGYSVAHTYGALPDPYTASATALAVAPTAGAPVPAIMLRAI